jgi:exodeoxyribonuclease VII small subunit
MPPKKIAFEKAMEDLEEIVKELELGQLSLEDSLKSFKKGMELAKVCDTKLAEAEKKITVLIEDANGNTKEKDFDIMGE